MTAKEAKQFLKEFLGDKPNFREERPGYVEEVYRQMDMLAEAIDMAIEALETQSKDRCADCQEFDCYGCEYKEHKS